MAPNGHPQPTRGELETTAQVLHFALNHVLALVVQGRAQVPDRIVIDIAYEALSESHRLYAGWELDDSLAPEVKKRADAADKLAARASLTDQR